MFKLNDCHMFYVPCDFQAFDVDMFYACHVSTCVTCFTYFTRNTRKCMVVQYYSTVSILRARIVIFNLMFYVYVMLVLIYMYYVNVFTCFMCVIYAFHVQVFKHFLCLSQIPHSNDFLTIDYSCVKENLSICYQEFDYTHNTDEKITQQNICNLLLD